MPAYITDAGRAALLLGPVTLGSFKLGSGFGYTPGSGDTDIHGSTVLSGTPSAPITTYDNLYSYQLTLPSDQTFTFGEVGLFFPNGSLFALYAFAQAITRTADPSDLDPVGGAVSFFVPASGDTAVIDLNANDVLGQVTIVDNLPAASTSPLKLYVVMHPLYTPLPIIAFRQLDLWNFTNYTKKAALATSAATLNSLTVGTVESPSTGDIVQFTDGPYKGICRKVVSSHYVGNTTTLVLSSPLSGSAPSINTPFVVLTPFGGGAAAASSSGTLLRDGSVIMAASFNFGGYKGTNLASPTVSTDAATKGYVDSAVSGAVIGTDLLKLDGTRAMTADLNLGTHKIVNVVAPTANTDAANKAYVDSVVASGGLPTSPVNYNSQRIINLGTPTASTDAATKDYVDTTTVKKDGSVSMTGNLSLGNNKVVGLATPTAATDAATKAYADAIRNPRVNYMESASGSVLVGVSASDELQVTLVGNSTFTLVGGVQGQRFVLRIKQDGAGNRAVTLPSTVVFSSDIPSYTASTQPNKQDVLGFIVDLATGSPRYTLVAAIKGF